MFSGNSAGGSGGGLYNEADSGWGGEASVTDSTFSDNSSPRGAGLTNRFSTLPVTGSTFSGNSAAEGGGIYNEDGTTTLRNTIVANSPSGMNCFSPTWSIPITDDGHNVSDDGSCNLAQVTGSLSNTDPLFDLTGLQDNGGPTKTVALQPDSPVVDLVGEEACPPPATD